MVYIKNIFIENEWKYIKLLNITVKFIEKDRESFLRYAKKDVYAFTFYYLTKNEHLYDKELKMVNNLLVNCVNKLGGTFFLPYMTYYDEKQLYESYPEIVDFIKKKQLYDPEDLFSNCWYEKYKNIVDIYEKEVHVKIPKLNSHIKKYSSEIINPHKYYKYVFSQPHHLVHYEKYLNCLLGNNSTVDLVKRLLEADSGCLDSEIIDKIKKYFTNRYFNKIRTIKANFNDFNNCKKVTVKKVKELLEDIGVNYSIDGYASFGDPGYSVKYLQKTLGTVGKTYIVHNKISIFDMIKRDSIMVPGNIINIDYKNIQKIAVPNSSVELVTLFTGLHSFPNDSLTKLMVEINRILKPNGFFIVREYNAHNNLKPLINSINYIKNITTGNSAVPRLKSFDQWKDIVKTFGFEDTYKYKLLDKTLENYLMCFKKINEMQTMPLSIRSSLSINDNEYKHPVQNTYMTLPNWNIVHILQEYGRYLAFNPWYTFPYYSTIVNYWKTCFTVTKQYPGYLKNFFSFYNFKNIIIGLIFSGITFTVGLSALPLWTVCRIQNSTSEKVQLVVINKMKKDLKTVDKSIRIIYDQEENGTLWQYIEIPKYKKFKDILCKLSVNGIEFSEISGNKDIMLEVLLKKEDSIKLDFIKSINGVKLIKKYSVHSLCNHDRVALNIKVNSLNSVLSTLINSSIVIDNCYGY